MSGRTGALIVIEGTADTDTDRQFLLLQQKMATAGYDVETREFPLLHEESSYFIRQYEAGLLGSDTDINPYAASLFYALDRFSVAKDIQASVANGKVVLCRNYTGSTMASQGARFPKAEQRRGYFIWLDNLESQLLQMVRPTQSFVLTRNLQREASNEPSTFDVYIDLCTLFPKDFQRVEISRNKQVLTEDAVHQLLWNLVQPHLPAETKEVRVTTLTKERKYTVPNGMPKAVELSYIETLDMLYQSNEKIQSKLEAYLHQSTPETARHTAETLARLVLPASDNRTYKYIPSDINTEHLEDIKAPSKLMLSKYWPRNEMELAQMLDSEISSDADYETKAKYVTDFFASPQTDSDLSKKVSYSFRLQTDFGAITDVLRQEVATDSLVQPLTPRNGYEVPMELEEAGLSDIFEACFDASFMMYSLLQKHGLHFEAQYVTLQGHKSVVEYKIALSELYRLQTSDDKVFQEMLAMIIEKHPLLNAVII